MLLKNFYTITKIYNEAESYAIQAELNADHEIYYGHFPQQPVVPGVCTIQLVKECVESIKNTSLQYSQIQSCKFLAVINPKADSAIKIILTLTEADGSINLQADILQKEQPVTKLKATLKAI